MSTRDLQRAGASPGAVRRILLPGLLTRLAILLALAFALRYFWWRATETMNPAAPWFFYLFLVAELVGFVEVILFFVTTWRRTRYEPPPAPPGRSVDVFIPTYNEPVTLLRDTVVAAVNIRYPHTTWVLDDGNRAEVEAMARELGARYLARPEHVHAKAGNLNYALARSEGELIVTLDADHVPMPNLLDELVGFFDDDQVALVQANQDFYNMDSFQHTTNWAERVAWQQQELFFNVIQPGKDALGAAMYCGSPAVIRRQALEEVGGFAIETVTEDMHTSLRMQERGWRVIYHNRTVARGLAPQTYDAYNTQWHRWGLGAMQVFRMERPLTHPRLTLGQRTAYFASFYFYWASLQKAFYLVIPAICILGGIFPLRATAGAYFSHFLPFLVLSVGATVGLQGGLRGFLLTERYNLIKLGSMLRTLGGLFRRKAAFKVTPKAQAAAAPWRRMLPYFGLIGLLGLAIVVGLLKLPAAVGQFEFWAYSVNIVFAGFFLYLLVPGIILALKRQELRGTYRFPQRLDLPVRYRPTGRAEAPWTESYARNLNRFGLSLTLDQALARHEMVELEIPLPDRTVRALGSVRWNEPIARDEGIRHANGIRFDEISPADQDAIALHVFWEIAPRHGELLRLTTWAQNLGAAIPEAAPARSSGLLDTVPEPAARGTR